MTRAARVLVVAGVLLAGWSRLPAQQAHPPEGLTPRVTRPAYTAAVAMVRAFYAFHFSRDMAFTAAAVRRRAQWLAPDLLALCRTYFTKPSSPDEVPSIDGDAFTDSQEYPRSFRVGTPAASGPSSPSPDTLLVPVTFAWPGAERRTLTVVAVSVRSSWLIADVRYASGSSLRHLLAAGP